MSPHAQLQSVFKELRDILELEQHEAATTHHSRHRFQKQPIAEATEERNILGLSVQVLKASICSTWLQTNLNAKYDPISKTTDVLACLSRRKCLLSSLRTWVPSPAWTWQKERPNSSSLSSDFICVPCLIFVQAHTKRNVKNDKKHTTFLLISYPKSLHSLI